MKNVYVDPNAPAYLNNILFGQDETYNRDNTLLRWRYLKEYCAKNDIALNTIDLLKEPKPGDVYVSFDHKRFLRRLYWSIRNKQYPLKVQGTFAKKILFHFEPPIVMPEIALGIADLPSKYNQVFFTWKTGHATIGHFHTPQIHEGVSSEFWQKQNRKLLTMINANRKAIFRYKELFTERVRAILYFVKTQEIDLYGFGWEARPLFPYWFHGGTIKKVYKGSVKNKYETLSNYTFALIFENCALPGYITEKIFDSLYAGTIPVYLGAPDIVEHIPQKCFIDMRNFKNYEELKVYLKSLSKEQIQEYKEYGKKFLESRQYTPFTKEHFAEHFVKACAV
jgi:alpha(1,3/1,4) fucosyltransferase